MNKTNTLEDLNDEQLAPAQCVTGPVLVTAGAGSGKTRLLTHRIAYMVEEHGIAPYNIIAITFTNKAANEMKERLGKLVQGADSMWVCTIHSMCTRILRANAGRIGFTSSFTIYGEAEKDRVVKRLLQANPKFLRAEKNTIKPESVAWHISNAKNELLSPDEYYKYIRADKNADLILETFLGYQKELLLSNAMDFDDILVKTYELFVSCPDVLEKYQEQFKYIHVDEFQDTNTVQYELVKLMASKYNNIFAVGDEDQCIYSWRGAKFTNVNSFVKDFDGTQVFKLQQNYRSTKNILDTANKIIRHNTNRLDKTLWTKNADGKDVSFFVAYNDLEEAEFVASKIKKAVIEENAKYSDFAVLMRINSLSRAVEEKFLNYQIPYKLYGGFKFFERKEVKDVLAYLKLVSNPKDNDSFVRVLSFPKKGIGDASVAKILASATENNMSALDVARTGLGIDAGLLKKLSPVVAMFNEFFELKETLSMYDLTSKVLERAEIMNSFSKFDEEDLTRIGNIENFQKSIYEFEESNEGATIDDYLQSVTLARDIDTMDDEENCVSLMTVHSAKGLEFKKVFIVGLCDGILPLSRAINSADPNELEEERRLMYVASTRAMEELTYTRPSTKFNFQTRRLEGTVVSRFLKEAGIDATQTAEHKPKVLNNYQLERFDNDEDDNVSTISTNKVSAEKLDFFKQFKVGTRVKHKSFGMGVVTVEVTDPVGAFVSIKFDVAGLKTLSLKFAPLEIVE